MLFSLKSDEDNLFEVDATVRRQALANMMFSMRSTEDILFQVDAPIRRQALAMMTTLIDIGPHPPTKGEISNLVKDHQRPIIMLNGEDDIVKTTQWSEPVVASAALQAARELQGDRSNFAIALDQIQQQRRKFRDIDNKNTAQLIGRILLMRARVSIKDSWFTVETLLTQLFGPSVVQPLLEKLAPEVKLANMNWTHFVTAPFPFDSRYTPGFWQYLLRRCAAVQGTEMMEYYDCILVAYRGDLNQPYEKGNVVLLGLTFEGPDFWWHEHWHMHEVLGVARNGSFHIPNHVGGTGDDESNATAPATVQEHSTMVSETPGNSMISLYLNIRASPRDARFYTETKASPVSDFADNMYCGYVDGLNAQIYPAAGDCIETLQAMIQDADDEELSRCYRCCSAFLKELQEQ